MDNCSGPPSLSLSCCCHEIVGLGGAACGGCESCLVRIRLRGRPRRHRSTPEATWDLSVPPDRDGMAGTMTPEQTFVERRCCSETALSLSPGVKKCLIYQGILLANRDFINYNYQRIVSIGGLYNQKGTCDNVTGGRIPILGVTVRTSLGIYASSMSFGGSAFRYPASLSTTVWKR